MPGTWGSLAALATAWLLIHVLGYQALLLAWIILLPLACLACAPVLDRLADADPGWIVIDEWLGQWLCLLIMLPLSGVHVWVWPAAFLAFRALDIMKPWPVSACERWGRPWWSIHADDLMAGIIAGSALGFAALFWQGGLE